MVDLEGSYKEQKGTGFNKPFTEVQKNTDGGRQKILLIKYEFCNCLGYHQKGSLSKKCMRTDIPQFQG